MNLSQTVGNLETSTSRYTRCAYLIQGGPGGKEDGASHGEKDREHLYASLSYVNDSLSPTILMLLSGT